MVRPGRVPYRRRLYLLLPVVRLMTANPIRNIDLSKIYHGDENGHGDIRGKVTGLNAALDC